MARQKTSVSFEEETISILARRAEESHLDRSAYLEQLIRADDLRSRLAADTAVLNAAGYSPDRASATTAAILAARGSR